MSDCTELVFGGGSILGADLTCICATTVEYSLGRVWFCFAAFFVSGFLTCCGVLFCLTILPPQSGATSSKTLILT